MLRLRSIYGNEKGMVLSVALMLLAILAVLGGAAVVATRTDIKIGGNYKTGTQAFYIAEAGLQAAIQELADNDGTQDFATVSLPATLFNATPFSNGNYTVSLILQNPTPRTIEVTSTGMAPNGASRLVKARVKQISDDPDQALTTNGNLLVSGNVDFKGTCGGAHSNGNMTLGNSNAQLADGFTASGTMDVSGTPCIGSTACFNNPPDPDFVLSTNAEKDNYEAAHQGQPEKPLPTINPADFAPAVAALGAAGKGYILNNDGTVTVGGTCDAYGLCTGGTGLAIPDGWEWDGTSWKVAGNSAAEGVFYAETDVKISGNAGSPSSPWQATIIARDSVEWSGNPSLKPYPTSDDDLKGITLVTGNDLKISGNIGLDGQGGAVLAHQQIGFSGNMTIYGFVFAGDGTPTWSGDPFSTATSGTNHFDNQSISGNPTIVYNCGESLCDNPACGISKANMVAGSWSEF